MKKYNQKTKDLAYFLLRWRNQIIDPSRFIISIPKLLEFFRNMKKYSKKEGAEELKLIDTLPCINDNTKMTGFDNHYFYQGIWAFKRILASNKEHHVDVGSDVYFIGYLTSIKKVTFIDTRQLLAKLENLQVRKGNILSLPYEDNSISSLSCLHVAEHIGLGRYGDPLDPVGTKKAVLELKRVLAKNGNLFFSLPIGKPRLCFNAHRIHSTKQILNYFKGLELVELSGIDDNGKFTKDIKKEILDSCDYGCGLFWFRKST